MAGGSGTEGLVVAGDSWLAQKLVGTLGGIFAFVLLWIAVNGGPQSGCPTSSPATGLCAMDWSFQTTNAARRIAYATVGVLILAVGSFLITRRGPTAVGPPPQDRTERRLAVAMVVLGLLGIALLVAAVAAGFATPPSRTLTFTNDQLPSVGDFLTASYGTERAATVYLTAGEAITATDTANWYAAGSTTPVCCGGGFPPSIEPAGQPYNYSGPWTTWYIVPKTGAYVIWVYAELPIANGPLVSNVSLTVTAYNVDYLPTVQLALGSLGGALFAAAVGVDWLVHPRIRLRRSTLRPDQGEPPPRK